MLGFGISSLFSFATTPPPQPSSSSPLLPFLKTAPFGEYPNNCARQKRQPIYSFVVASYSVRSVYVAGFQIKFALYHLTFAFRFAPIALMHRRVYVYLCLCHFCAFVIVCKFIVLWWNSLQFNCRTRLFQCDCLVVVQKISVSITMSSLQLNSYRLHNQRQ